MEIAFEEAVFGVEKDIQVPRHEPCEHCDGTGAEPGTNTTQCPQCRGTGEIRRVQQSLLGSFVNVTTCPRCQGEGTIITNPCTECHGRKKIRRLRTISVTIPAGVDDGTQLRLSGEGELGSRGGPPGNLYVFLSVKKHSMFLRRGNDIYLELPINFAQAALGDELIIPTLEGEEKLSIPAGTQTNKVFRLRGKGVPHVRGSGRGDMLISVRTITPTRLNDEQKELLRQLGESLGQEVIPQQNRGFFERMVDALGEAFKV